MNRWRSGPRRCIGRQVVVDTRDGHTYRGVLRACFRDSLLLAAVEDLDGEEPIKLLGDKGVPWSNFSTWQEV
jgi:small nuclear ribonucleoprotein (snRNP)-like protein